MTPSIGRIVHYRLTEANVREINRRRADARYNAIDRANDGTQVHTGNEVKTGDIFPLVITRIWSAERLTSELNGQVLLDGSDTLWVTSISESSNDPVTGESEAELGKWFWPPRV